ncbi:VaFE repeat-containing surface-anchored protein [Propioniferax innocua]|nr:VaFE repeat-containing surface-anchored protein [Propioniferax innocua]
MIVAFGLTLPTAQAVETGNVFKGYIDEAVNEQPPYSQMTENRVNPLVIEPVEGGGTEVVYCFNQTLYQPTLRDSLPYDPNDPLSGRELEFDEHYGESMLGYAKEPRAGADAGVLAVIKNGYTGGADDDAAGIQGKFGLNDNEFRFATQLAIWYWTDSYDAETYDVYLGDISDVAARERIMQAYTALTGQDPTTELVPVDPASATLNIYDPRDRDGTASDIQNLVGVKFVDPNTGEEPTPTPTPEPTPTPTPEPTPTPTPEPTPTPTPEPTPTPTPEPTPTPTPEPTPTPTPEPTPTPTPEPTPTPTPEPTPTPTPEPTPTPTPEPTPTPTPEPTPTPTPEPTPTPTPEPTPTPTPEPTPTPTPEPTPTPTPEPTPTPTPEPTPTPTPEPTPTPTPEPTPTPTPEPTPRPEPSIGTTAVDKADGDKVLAAEGGVIVDTVAYEGLTPGLEYTLTGELMDKATGEGTGITGEVTFTPEAVNGEVDVEFTVPTGFAGKELVVFEYLTLDGDKVAEHTDINDVNQTVAIEDVDGPAPSDSPAPTDEPTDTPARSDAPTSGAPTSDAPAPTDAPAPAKPGNGGTLPNTGAPAVGLALLVSLLSGAGWMVTRRKA